MSEIFISYARENEATARRVADSLRALGYGVWRDDQLPTHRPYAEVIEERLKSARAVVVLWSAEATKSEWVRAEADLARGRRTLTQARLDGTSPPLPFNQIQCADLRGWRDSTHPGWLKITASVAELLGRQGEPTVSPRPSPERIRIAVELRAIVMAAGRDAQGLASGLNGELAKAMACLPGLRVLTAETVHGETAPAYVLDGAVRRSGDQLRLAVRLLSSLDGSILWSENYDGALRDLFAFQERAATLVAANVDTIVRALEVERTARLGEEELDARDLYYRAIGGLRRMERQSLMDGARFAEKVIALVPDHAHALGMAGCIYLNIWMLGFGEGEKARLKAADRAARALALSEHDHWVAGISSMVLAWVGQPIEVSVGRLDRILTAAPSFAPGWFWSGVTRIRAGDPVIAMAHLARAVELEPLTALRSTMSTYAAFARLIAGDFEAALPPLIEGLRARPQWTSQYIFLAIGLAHLGRLDEARRQLDLSETVAPVAKSRWPTRDCAQRSLLCEGLAKAGFSDAEPIFTDL